jgi:hypothetical protein
MDLGYYDSNSPNANAYHILAFSCPIVICVHHFLAYAMIQVFYRHIDHTHEVFTRGLIVLPRNFSVRTNPQCRIHHEGTKAAITAIIVYDTRSQRYPTFFLKSDVSLMYHGPSLLERCLMYQSAV